MTLRIIQFFFYTYIYVQKYKKMLSTNSKKLKGQYYMIIATIFANIISIAYI